MESSEVDELFDEVEEEHTEKPYSYADQMMEKIEQEYRQPGVELNERQKEKQALNTKLGLLQKKLNRQRNVKNPRKTAINQSMALKRKEIRDEIERVKDRLHQIDMEEKGSEVTSKNLTDATINQDLKR